MKLTLLAKFGSFFATALVCGAVALIFPLTVSHVASAAPVYSVIHQSDTFGNAGPSQVIGPRDTPIDFSFNGFTDFQERNTGNVQARAAQGSLGITAIASNNGGFTSPQRQEVNASFQFDTIFGSSGTSPIDVILNLTLSGIITPGNNNRHTVSVFAGPAGVPSSQSSGSYSEILGGPTIQDGLLSGFSDDGTDQTISTNPFTVSVNQPVSVFMQLFTGQPYAPIPGSIDFGGTMELSNVGDVFTIVGAQGITVNSLDAGIVNNRFGEQLSTVPLPAALPLFGTGLAAMGFIGWRRKRRA